MADRDLWRWGWSPAWMLCSGDDDGDDDGGGGGAGDDDSGGGGAGGGAGDDDSGSGGGAGGGAGDDDTGGGVDAGGGAGGAGAGDSGGSEGSGDSTGAGGGGAGGADGEDGGGSDTATGPDGGDTGAAESAAESTGGVSGDVGAALDAAGSTTEASPAAAASQAGVGVGGVSSAMDVLSGLDSPVSQALGGALASNAFGPGESVMTNPTSPTSDPASLETVQSPFDATGIPNAPVGGLGSPFGAGPQSIGGIQDASPVSSLDNLSAIATFGQPGFDAANNMTGPGPGPSPSPAVADQGWGPTPVNNDTTDPTVNQDQLALGLNPTGDLQGGLPAGLPGSVPGAPMGQKDDMAQFSTPKTDQLSGVPGNPSANQRVAAGDAAGMFGPLAAPGGQLADSVPTPADRPSTAPLGVDSTGQQVLAGNDVTSPLDPSGPAPSGTTPDTVAAKPDQGTSTSQGVADALAGADGGTSLASDGSTSSGGSGANGGTLAQQITAPIPGGGGGHGPQIPDRAAEGPTAGSYNPELGIYGNPLAGSLPGGAAGPSLGMSNQTFDGALTVGNTDMAAAGVPEGSYNPEAGVYDALNNA